MYNHFDYYDIYKPCKSKRIDFEIYIKIKPCRNHFEECHQPPCREKYRHCDNYDSFRPWNTPFYF